MLTGADKRVRFLTKTENTWMSREDSVDMNNTVNLTEVLVLNADLTTFTMSKITSDKQGKVVENFGCAGSVQTK